MAYLLECRGGAVRVMERALRTHSTRLVGCRSLQCGHSRCWKLRSETCAVKRRCQRCWLPGARREAICLLVAWPELGVRVNIRWAGVERAPPDLDLLLSVFRSGLLLVEAGQSSVHALVEAPCGGCWLWLSKREIVAGIRSRPS